MSRKLSDFTGRVPRNVDVDNIQLQGSVREDIYSLTGTDINPANGTIQFKTLASNTTFTITMNNGEYVTIMLNDGSNRTASWPSVQWVGTVGGNAPTLETSGYNVITFWKMNGSIYGMFGGAS